MDRMFRGNAMRTAAIVAIAALAGGSGGIAVAQEEPELV